MMVPCLYQLSSHVVPGFRTDWLLSRTSLCHLTSAGFMGSGSPSPRAGVADARCAPGLDPHCTGCTQELRPMGVILHPWNGFPGTGMTGHTA